MTVDTNDRLVDEIAAFCKAQDMAESTFGRHVANDGKFVARLREGKSITLKTLERVQSYMAEHQPQDSAARTTVMAAPYARPAAASLAVGGEDAGKPAHFRFFDNRQKYLLFVNTCSEKWVIADRIGMELRNVNPRPPAMRLFDAGVGDGTVLTRLMRAMHHRYPTMPFYIVGKEISLEDVRLALEKMPDRFYEHPATVLVMTNMFYAEAPWLRPSSPTKASSLVWHELELEGGTSRGFEEQITDLQDFLARNWMAGISSRTGNPVYDRPVVLVIYRKDHRFLLDSVIPQPGAVKADYDLVLASQPYRLRAPVEFKAEKVVAPLASSLGPGGRLIGIHSYGHDPGAEIVQEIWPDDDPFRDSRHDVLQAVQKALGSDRRKFKFNAYSDSRSIFKYHMHTLPNELSDSIGTSTLFAAWNAAIYVCQVEESRLNEAVAEGRYIDAAQRVLHRHGGLWFNDESYVVSRPNR